jgi:hypothetical protein
MGFNPSREKFRTLDDHSKPFLDYYLQFRERVKMHMASGLEPILSLSEKPTGGQQWSGWLNSEEAGSA